MVQSLTAEIWREACAAIPKCSSCSPFFPPTPTTHPEILLSHLENISMRLSVLTEACSHV